MMTSRRGGSQRLLARVNTRAVLGVLADQGPLARPELVAAAGISKTAVGNILEDLAQLGLVRRVGQDADRRGPVAGIWALEAHFSYRAVVDFGRRTISTGIVDLAGNLHGRIEEPRAATVDQSALLAADLVRQSAQVARVAPSDLRGTVVGVPSELPDQLLLPLREMLPGPVSTMNSTRLAALAEMAERGSDSFVLLRVGGQIDAAIVQDGQVVQGTRQLAGHLELLSRHLTGGLTIGSESVAADAHTAGLPGELDAKEIFALAHLGDTRAAQVVQQTAIRLVPLVLAIQALVDPELIILGGGIGANYDLLVPVLETELAGVAVTFAGAESMNDPVLLGAAVLASEMGQAEALELAVGGPSVKGEEES